MDLSRAHSVPNLLTYVRFLFVPLLAFVMIGSGGSSIWALSIFLFAIATDALDGWVARQYSSATDLGAFLDPIADKALIAVALILLAVYQRAAWWIVVVIVMREVAVTLLRSWLLRRGDGVIPAGQGGKIKTLLQAVAIAVLLVPWPSALRVGYTLGEALLVLSAAVAVLSGVQYAYQGWKIVYRKPV